jgi:protein TonB
MKRLQLKCLVTSTALHGLLIALVLASMGFSSVANRNQDLPILDVIPARLLDEALSGGGDPRPPGPLNKPPAEIKAIEPPPTPVQPAKPPEAKPQTIDNTPPPKPVPSKPAETPTAIDAPKPLQGDEPAPPKKTKVDISKKTIRSTVVSPKDQERAEREATENALQEARNTWRNQFSRAVRSIRTNLSSRTTIEVSGGGVGGTGGEAYANYAQAILSLYDQAWRDPEDVADLTLSVRARIIIARDGRVMSSVIVQQSGNAAMDKSVQQALERISRVPAFPAESKDLERTFYINFNLKTKRLLG